MSGASVWPIPLASGDSYMPKNLSWGRNKTENTPGHTNFAYAAPRQYNPKTRPWRSLRNRTHHSAATWQPLRPAFARGVVQLWVRFSLSHLIISLRAATPPLQRQSAPLTAARVTTSLRF